MRTQTRSQGIVRAISALARLSSHSCSCWLPVPGRTQETQGDQFLDGIGETALVARYLLDGDTKDLSRNQFHAIFSGTAPSFADDSTFGRVLVLDAGKRESLQIPAEALVGIDSLSVTGWVHLRSDAPWQRFFDFGTGAACCFFCTPTGRDAEDGFRARITADGWTNEQGPVSQRVAVGQWMHLAVTLDAANADAHDLRQWQTSWPGDRCPLDARGCARPGRWSEEPPVCRQVAI